MIDSNSNNISQFYTSTPVQDTLRKETGCSKGKENNETGRKRVRSIADVDSTIYVSPKKLKQDLQNKGDSSLVVADKRVTGKPVILHDGLNNNDHDRHSFASIHGYFNLVGVTYQLQLLMFCFYKAFIVHKFKKFTLATEEIGVRKFDDIVFCDNDELICIQVKHVDVEREYNCIGFVELFPSGNRKWKGMFSINKYFSSFVQYEEDNMKYLILYTNTGLKLTEENRLRKTNICIGFIPLEFDKLDIGEEKYNTVKDCLHSGNSMEEHCFYQFSRNKSTRKELLKLLDTPSSAIYDAKQLKRLKKKFLDKFIFAVNQPSREKLNSLIKHEIEKNTEPNLVPLVYNRLYEGMFYYLKNPEGIYVTRKIAKKFLKHIEEPDANIFCKIFGQATNVYKKETGLRNHTPYIMYKLELLMLCLYRMYQHKNEELYTSIENGIVNICSNICLHKNDKTTHVWFRYGSEDYIDYNMLFPNNKEDNRMLFINRFFIHFIKHCLSIDSECIENFVIYTNMGLNLTDEGYLRKTSIRFKSINIENYKVLRDYLYTEDGKNEHGFYRFSRRKRTRRELLKLLDPGPINCDALRLEEMKRNFLDTLVFAVNQPDREKLSSFIKDEIGKYDAFTSPSEILSRYVSLREVALRWLDDYKVHYIERKKIKKLFKDIKNKKSSRKVTRIPNEDKDQFARTVVADRGLCHYREFREFLDTKEGEDMFNVLHENGADRNLAVMLCGTGIGVISAFKRLYYKLFGKDGKRTDFLKNMMEYDIELRNISSMLGRAGNRAPEALEALQSMLDSKLSDGKSCLEFFANKRITGNVCSILNGAGDKAPEAIKTLQILLNTKLDNGRTYLEFFIEKNIIKNISSMLSGSGVRAPDGLKALFTVLNTKLKNGKTYLEFFAENNIMENISSMLSGAGDKAPEALEALYTVLNTKLNNGITYLEFFVENGIMENISSILSKTKDKAADTLEALYITLNEKLNDGKTFLEFFVEKNIMKNISSILHGAGSKAPKSLKQLFTILSTKISNGKTYLEFLVENKIMGNISSILHGAKDKAHKTLKTLYIVLNTKLKNDKTYLEFFVQMNLIENVSSILNGAGDKAPEALKELFTVLNTKLGNGKTYLEFFVEKNIMKNISSMLSGAGSKSPEALKELNIVLSTKLDNGKTYLELFVEKNVMGNISNILHGSGVKSPKAFKSLFSILSTKLGNGKTYLEFFIEKGIMGNISSMLGGARHKAHIALKHLHTLLNTKLHHGKTYLEFFTEMEIMGSISSMLSGAGHMAPEALKELYSVLNAKLRDGKTYLEFLVENKIMKNISSMLGGSGTKAPEALKELNTVLSTNLMDGKTYLEFFVENKIMGNISSMLSKSKSNAPEALKELFTILSTKLSDGKTYLEFFIENNVMKNISGMLSGSGGKAPEALRELCIVLSTKMDDGKTYLEFCIEKDIMGNISSMLDRAKGNAPEALKGLFNVLNTMMSDGKTYLEFFIEKKILKNLSSMLSGSGSKSPEALKELCAVLNTKLSDEHTYLEFYIEENIMSSMSSMLNRAGSKAPDALRELHNLLFNEKYLEHFTKEGLKLCNLSSMLHGTQCRAPYTLKQVHNVCFDSEGNKTQYFNDLIKANHKPAKLYSILRESATASFTNLDVEKI